MDKLCFLSVRKLAKPPHLIMRIMDCALILFQKRVDPVQMDPERPCVKPSWSEALKLMASGGFLQGLMNFPKVIIQTLHHMPGFLFQISVGFPFGIQPSLSGL